MNQLLKDKKDTKVEPSFIFMSDVRANEDSYTWQELNCFYRPFSLSLQTYRKEFFQLSLMFSAFQGTYLMGHVSIQDVNNNFAFFSYYREHLAKIFKANIGEERFRSKEEMNEKLKEAITENKIVVFPTDLFCFPYINHYMELHHRHFIVIKGFNTKKQIYYIMDNQHMDMGFCTKYCDFMLKCDTVYEMAESYKNYADSDKDYMYFWTVEQTSTDTSDSIKLCVEYFKEHLTRLVNHEEKKCCIEKDMVEDLKRGCFERNIGDDIKTNSMRIVYFDNLLYFLQLIDKNDTRMGQMEQTIYKVHKEWDELKNKIVYYFQKGLTSTPELEAMLEKVMNDDEALMKDVLAFLNSKTIVITEEDKKPYIVKNNHNADYKIADQKVMMNLSKDSFYDTWTYNDDACQILFPAKDRDFTIEMELSVNAVLGGSLLAGFLFRYEYNYKVMFGNYRSIQVSIFAPNEEEAYLFSEKHPMDQYRYFRVTKKEDEYQFFIRKSEDEDWQLLYTREDSNRLDYFGIFTKTWENCETHAVFERVMYNGENLF